MGSDRSESGARSESSPDRMAPRTKREAPPLPTGCEAMLAKADVVAALRISVRHLDEMIAAGEYPRPDTHLGRNPRWRRETHDRWVRARCGVVEQEPDVSPGQRTGRRTVTGGQG